MKEDNIKRGHWPYVRAIATHPGQDGIIRLVIVRILRGTCKRPIVKIFKLETDGIEVPLDVGNAG